MHLNKGVRQRNKKNQPPPPKVLEKLKRDQAAAHNQHYSPSSSPSSFSKSSILFHLLLFCFSVCIGFFGFSFVFTSWLYQDKTFVPFGQGKTFPIYETFPEESSNGRWSSLIPGHYFGLRSARPNSTLVSIMWFRQKLRQNEGLPIRHLCRHEDQLNTYRWNFNDLHTFGHQTLIDDNLHLNTSFIRLQSDILLSKIKIIDTSPSNSNESSLNSLILYAATEQQSDNITLIQAHNGHIAIQAQSQTSGNYILNFKVNEGNLVLQSFLTANSTLDILEQTIKANLFFYKHDGHTLFVISNSDHDESLYKSNFIAYQVIFDQKLEVDIEMLFDGAEIPSGFNYEMVLAEKQQDFLMKFEEKFKFRNFSQDLVTFARTILSSTIGSIGYYYGYSFVDSEHSLLARPYGPVQLLASAPSRSLFPRGFLWDEGFHQLLISRWDPKLSMTIIKSWLSLMNDDGWIPREVILGAEAMSRVPKEYIVQHSSNGNPPSLLLAIESLIDRNEFNQQWLIEIYPRLQRWYHWFNTTQTGQMPFTFRWQGRNSTTKFELNPKTMASGFDDYPRATHPTDDEIHIDLRCWMALASRLMSKITKALNIDDEYEIYYHILSDNDLMEKLHWSEQYQMFCDKGLHSNDVRLRKLTTEDGRSWTERVVNSEPHYDCVGEFGYVSLFPFIMKLLQPNNPKLLATLYKIEDEDFLWTPYGLRSLAKKSSYYKKFNTEHDPPYWRGSIWINMNYLVLKALNHYAKEPGPYQQRSQNLHDRLKMNLVNAVHQEYLRSGYIWEQYNDDNGKGRGAHPFTGWSALIVQIMSHE